MNCFECAKVDDDVPAVAVCRHCGAGLCLAHFAEARSYRVAGTTFGCPHELPRSGPSGGVPAGTAAAARHPAGVS